MDGGQPGGHETIIDEILQREGSIYTDRPSDRGGPTKFGITLATLRRHQPGATAGDVQNLSEDQARAIYETDYIVEPGFDRIPSPLRELLIDFGVTSGPATAIKALQVAVGAEPDGIIGPKTLALLDAYAKAEDDATSHAYVYAAVLRAYFSHFVSVALGDQAVFSFRFTHPSTQLENLRGWIARASGFIR